MLRSKIIFLADDDCDDTEFFTDALDEISTECSLFVFCNGAELLDGLKNSTQLPDIIFIDINMPIMDGFETLSLIKENNTFKSIPTVIYSTSSNQNHISKAYESGATSYFKKPSDFQSLRDKLNEILVIDWGKFMHPGKLT